MDSLTYLLSKPILKRHISTIMVAGILVMAAFFGQRAEMRWLLLTATGLGTLALLQTPQLGLAAVIAAALVVPLEISTGTEVRLNPATLLIPLLISLRLLERLRRSESRWAASAVNRPLALFVLAGLLSLFIGNATWDPAVPRSGSFWLVQLSQWAIFFVAALAFWLVANLQDPETWLPRLTWLFLSIGGGIVVVWMALGTRPWLRAITTVTFQRAPFWVLLAALAGGQLLFNAELGRGRQVLLVAVLASVLKYAFVLVDDRTSNWVGIVAVAGVLVWLRLPRLRRVILVVGGLLLILALVSGFLYEFAGGDEKWAESGESRLLLIERVIRVTLRNPVTGLGPASYRPYANLEPLQYYGALWWHPQINSHNNYVDLFSHTGLLGLGLFLWFATELWRLGQRLTDRYQKGFMGGYVGGMTAAWTASLVIMLLADWMLPFVYNIGFPGFQASLLVWLFLGGLVAVDARGDDKGKGCRG